MKKIKKRLPALLLALIVAVMPVMMAVPASATDLLNGGTPSESGYHALDLFFPLAYIDGSSVDVVSSGYPCIIYKHDSQYHLVVFVDGVTGCNFVDGSGKRYSSVDSKSSFAYYLLTLDLDFSYTDSWSGSSLLTSTEYFYRVQHYGSVCVFNFSSDVLADENVDCYSVGSAVIGDPGGPGVLSVFAGIGSWLAGAVSSMMTIFWTASGGFTVLGYLAVASLAISVILLFVALIAGWLKFK